MTQPEVWLRGPVDGVPALLQPVAHGLLQCRDEVRATLATLGAAHLRTRPSGAGSIEFHARHAMGSLDRLLTYARGEQLSPAQLAALAAEKEPDARPDLPRRLVADFDAAVERALAQLRATDRKSVV